MLEIRHKRIVKTRKEQTCYACEDSIEKGSHVIYVTAKQDDKHHNVHLHLECNKEMSKRKIAMTKGCLHNVKQMPTVAPILDSDLPF